MTRRYTTACLLLRLFDPELDDIVFLPFHEIMGAVARGEADVSTLQVETGEKDRFSLRRQVTREEARVWRAPKEDLK